MRYWTKSITTIHSGKTVFQPYSRYGAIYKGELDRKVIEFDSKVGCDKYVKQLNGATH